MSFVFMEFIMVIDFNTLYVSCDKKKTFETIYKAVWFLVRFDCLTSSSNHHA